LRFVQMFNKTLLLLLYYQNKWTSTNPKLPRSHCCQIISQVPSHTTPSVSHSRLKTNIFFESSPYILTGLDCFRGLPAGSFSLAYQFGFSFISRLNARLEGFPRSGGRVGRVMGDVDRWARATERRRNFGCFYRFG